MACLDVLALADASSPGREAVLAHAADCLACRCLLRDLAALEGIPKPPVDAEAGRAVMTAVARAPRRGWVPLAAAAAILLALGISWRHKTEGPIRPPDIRTQAAPAPPALEVSPVLGQASALVLKPGSRVEIGREEGRPLATLLEGALWLEDPGEPVILRAAGASIAVESATLLLERTSAAHAGLWLQEAMAAEGAVRLVVLSGKALVNDAVVVNAGMRWSPGAPPSPFRPEELAWRGDEGWRIFEAPGRLKEGVHALGPQDLPGSYAWEALVRRTDRSGSVGILFPAGGRHWRVPLGRPLEQEGWIRLRVEVAGGWVRVLAGSSEALSKPVAALDRALAPSGEKRCGVEVWGGDLELAQARWRALP